jgi:uncharacterized protein
MNLIEAMSDPKSYPDKIGSVRVMETHISWVFLTGKWAYKIKKPFKNPFLDYSTLELRKRYCEEELRINKLFAPLIYESVMPICQTPQGIMFGSDGEVIEYCIKMHEFPQSALLLNMLQAGTLDESHVEQLGLLLAKCHEEAAHLTIEQPWATTERITGDAQDNFRALAKLLPQQSIAKLAHIHRQSDKLLEHLSLEFDNRRRSGMVRECHGDLHLGNLIWYEGQVQLFDGIEFNESFRWIDVMNDLAFVLMDLEDHNRRDLANLLLNRYLEVTGDYGGLRVLTNYKLYRAMVRAKTAAMRAQQHRNDTNIADKAMNEVNEYLDYADHLLDTPTPILILTHGFSGSGKTWGTEPLIRIPGVIRIRSDIERKRLHGIAPLQSSESSLLGGIYGERESEETYQQLVELARIAIKAGNCVILDAASLHKSQRDLFVRLARELQVEYWLLPFVGDEATLRARVQSRAKLGRDASEATIAVLEQQLKDYVTLTDSEVERCTTVDTSRERLSHFFAMDRR